MKTDQCPNVPLRIKVIKDFCDGEGVRKGYEGIQHLTDRQLVEYTDFYLKRLLVRARRLRK